MVFDGHDLARVPAQAGRRYTQGLMDLGALVCTAKRPDWALVEVVPLWLSVVLLMAVSARRDRAAGWLLVPYLAWVGFAAVLNWSVVRLNGPFSGP